MVLARSSWIRRSGRPCVVPSTQRDLPILPNFFLAVKGPDGSPNVARLQANYDGTLGERGMRVLITSFGKPAPDIDNIAHTTPCTYQSGFLVIYAIHSLRSELPKPRIEYFMTKIGAYAITGSSRGFREGVAAYRSAKDWAKQQRDTAIKNANERATGSYDS